MPAAADPTRVTVPVPPDRVVTDADALRWGIVSTIRAPLRDIARFAAYHLDLGAAQIHIYLDQPDDSVQEFFAPYKAIRITQCSDDYWNSKPEKARKTHQLRQAFNATRTYRRSPMDWLVHIDVDEFLLSPRPIAQLLTETPADAAFARLRPAEMLAQPDAGSNPGPGPSHFKLTRDEANQTKAALAQIYPTFGAFVPEGFISYTGGKNFARTGLSDVRLGIHALRHKGAIVDNGHILQGAHVGHAHAPSWDVFQRHFQFRMTRGSYRRKPNEPMRLQDIFDLVISDAGDTGLRRFFDEMCLASPGLLERLAAHDMLLSATLDLDQKTARWFGDLPPDQGAVDQGTVDQGETR